MVTLAPGMRYLGVSGKRSTTRCRVWDSTTTPRSFPSMAWRQRPSAEGGIVFPNLDSVAQFRVQTSSFSAENGRQPLQVQMITKSGTNEIHGTLWEFLRNDALDARNTFANRSPSCAAISMASAPGRRW